MAKGKSRVGSETVTTDGKVDSAGSEAIATIGDTGTIGGTDGSSDFVAEPVAENETKPFPESDPIAAGEPVKKKRGRPKGSGTKSSTEAGPEEKPGLGVNRPYAPDEISMLAFIYVNANNLAANALKAPQFIISPEEAETIAKPLAKVLAQHGIYFGGATSAYAELIMAFTTVYGMRVMATVLQAKMRKDAEAQERASNPEPAPSQTVRPRPASGRFDFSALQQAG